MSTLTKEQEQYIEHEVKLRIHEGKFDNLEKAIERLDNKIDIGLKHLDDKIDYGLKHLDNKMTWGFGVFIAISIVGWIIPIAIQFVHVK